MSGFTDEELSAFLDGELPEARAAALEAALDRDPALGARMAALSEADALIKAAAPAPSNATAPPEMLAALARLAEAKPGSAANVVALRPKARAPSAGWLAAMAASIALVVGGIGGAAFQASRDGVDAAVALEAAVGVIRPANPLHAALETIPSGTVAPVPGGAVKPVLSFVDPAARGCREFEMAEAGATSVGVACKAGDVWRIEILLAAAPQPAASEVYVPASGYDDALLASALDRLMPGEALDPAAEKALMARGWKAATSAE